MRKKYYSYIAAVALAIQSISIPAVAYADSFNLTSIKNDKNNIILTFSETVGDDIVEKLSLSNQMGESISDINAKTNENSVIIEVPSEYAGEEINIAISNDAVSESGVQLETGYIADVVLPGYSEDFDDYEVNSWKLLAYEYQKGGDATNDDRKNENIIGTLGKLKPMAAAKTISDKEDGKSYIYSQSSTTFYKSNYTDYDFTDQSLFFDYQRQIDTQGDAGSKSYINAKAFIRSGEVSYSAANYVIEDGGYYFGIEQMGEKLVIGKFKGSWHIDNMHKASNDATVLKTVDISSNPIVKATEYSFRVDAVDVEDGVKITAYLKNSSGVYEEIISVVDTEDVFESGTALFMTGKTNWSAYNTNIFDNISFIGTTEHDFITAGEYETEIIEQINNIFENKDNGTDYTKELESISKKIDVFESIGGNFDEEALDKYRELIRFSLKKLSSKNGTIGFVYSQMIDEDSIEGNFTVLDADGNVITDRAYLDADNAKIVRMDIPQEYIGKILTLCVKPGIMDKNGNIISESYINTYKIDGYYEDFENYKNNSWKIVSWSHQAGVDAIRNDEANDNYMGEYKKLKIISNPKIVTQDGVTMNYSDQSVALYKTDYEEYGYGDQSVQFNYIRLLNAENSPANNNLKMVFRADKLQYLKPTGSTHSFNLGNGAYYLGIENNGTSIVIGKWIGGWQIDSFGKVPSNVSVFVKNENISLEKGVEYTFRVDANDTDDGGVEITAYMLKDGKFEEIASVVDRNDPIKSGYTMFFCGSTGSTKAYNAHVVDNVSFARNEETTNISEDTNNAEEYLNTFDSIVNKWNSMSAESIDSNEYTDNDKRLKYLKAAGIESEYEQDFYKISESMANVNMPVLTYGVSEEGNEYNTVTVKGTTSSKNPGKNVKVAVKLNENEFINTAVTNDKGEFEIVVELEGLTDVGFLDVYVEGDEFKKTFEDFAYFTARQTRMELLEILKDETTSSSFKDNFVKNQNEFGIVTDVYNGVEKQNVADLLFEKRAELTVDNIQDTFFEAGIISALNENKLDLIVNDNDFIYPEKMGISDCQLKKIYDENLSVEGRKGIFNSMTGKGFKCIEDVQKTFNEETVLWAIAKPLDNGSDCVAEVLTKENAKEVGLDVSKYLLANSDKINRELLANKYNTISDLQKEINRLVDLYPKTAASKPSGSSGNSSGGGGGIYVIPQNVTNNKEENKEDSSNELLLGFSDIESVEWAKEAIVELSQKGIINGVGNNIFSPNSFVTREQLAKMICLAFGYETSDSVSNFEDVDQNQWYAVYVNTLCEKGIMKGIGSNKFGVGEFVTREDFATVLFRIVYNDEEYTKKEFIDSDLISDYAKDGVSYLNFKGIINGFSDNSFRPRDFSTRAQAAKMIYDSIRE